MRYDDSPTISPIGRHKAGWYDIHEKHKSICKSSKTEVVLIGDSIIAGLRRYPNVWQKFLSPHQALNFGVGGDHTQHVLWRAKSMTLPKTCKYLFIHCVTNP